MEEPRAKIKVCLVGANRGCKTSLVRNHVLDNFDDGYIVTLGTKVSKKSLRLDRVPDNAPRNVDLLVWDVISQRGLSDLLKRAYFEGARGVLAVADLTRKETLEDLNAWIRAVQEVAGPGPVAVVGANSDRKAELQASPDEVARVAGIHAAPCFFPVGPSGEELEAAFRYLAGTVLEDWFRKREPALKDARTGDHAGAQGSGDGVPRGGHRINPTSPVSSQWAGEGPTCRDPKTV